MKVNYVMFGVLGFFFLIVGIIYGWLSYSFEPGIEWVGFPALLMVALMCWMIAAIIWMNERRHGRGAQDVDDAPVESEAGLQGIYAPYSWAPLWTAIGCSMAFAGVPIGWWLVVLGVIVAMYGVITWVMEFSRGTHAH
ncbi:MAG: cytochrome c oxidase subunit 4 [Dermabacter sp.]|nr:cytochrome c oxidase subunit 4 [Dermabacter sp.]